MPSSDRATSVTFAHTNLNTDKLLRRWYDILLHVIADLTLELDGVIAFDCPEAPVVELALALRDWLSLSRKGQGPPFTYQLIEAEDPFLLRFVAAADPATFVVESPWNSGQRFPPVPTTCLVEAGERYLTQLDVDCQQVGLNLGQMFSQPPQSEH